MVCRKVDAALGASKDVRALGSQACAIGAAMADGAALDCIDGMPSSVSGGDVPTRIAVRITTARPIVSSTAALLRSNVIVPGLESRGFTTRQLNAPTTAVIAITTSLRKSACP